MTRSFSIAALLAANLIPLFGVLFFKWDANLVLALFWIENLIIGGFNLIKMITASIYHKRLSELALCAFFALHFGFFCCGHGLLLWDLMGFEDVDTSRFFSDSGFGLMSIFLEGASIFLSFIEMHGTILMLSIGALVLSHLVSFIENFLLRGEIFHANANSLMAKPYGQILIMHTGLILGAFAIDRFGSTLWLLLIMVLFKIIVDIKMHLKRRTTSNKRPIEAS